GAQLPALIGVPAPAHRSLPVGFGFYARLSSEGAAGLRPFCTWPCCRDAHPLGQIFAGVKRPGLRGRGAPDRFFFMEQLAASCARPMPAVCSCGWRSCTTERNGEIIMNKRKVEVFSAGCPACAETVKL